MEIITLAIFAAVMGMTMHHKENVNSVADFMTQHN